MKQYNDSYKTMETLNHLKNGAILKKLLVFCIITCFSIMAWGQDTKKIVISSSPNATIDQAIVNLFIDELGKGLTNSGKYTILQNRKEAAAILEEELKYQAYVDDEQQLEVGKFYGADYSCYVSIQKIGRNFNITCKLFDFKTGASTGKPFSMATENGEDDIIKLAHTMAKELALERSILQK